MTSLKNTKTLHTLNELSPSAMKKVLSFCEQLNLPKTKEKNILRGALLAEYTIKDAITRLKNKPRQGIKDKEKISTLQQEMCAIAHILPPKIPSEELEKIIEKTLLSLINQEPHAEPTTLIANCMKEMRKSYFASYDGRTAIATARQLTECLLTTKQRSFFQ
ncbi:hypothetical protein CWB96_00215 [Pseudoalteromonas citrea]|uniref:Uncharacterized protein n=1 Tax=Pseudoalteromonas citrea TaxID=43655 RepID=A0A5S3XW46_9GAMM|nr:hypothetical protein [Pseudoalteromonas citrea]TMP46290.1 hypothetical protein CWB97_02210 [Pseudoalteromonas citrea]TMP63066.1 hypothetical protein CWB96_00215 [Pseudoalteromonas citrea]